MRKRSLETPETVSNPSPNHKRRRSSPMAQAIRPFPPSMPYGINMGPALPPHPQSYQFQPPAPLSYDAHSRQSLFVYGANSSMQPMFPQPSHVEHASAAAAASTPYYYPQHLQPQYIATYYQTDERPIRRKSKSKQSISWTPQEDKLLLELKDVHKLGWREILNHFKDRTANACQFRWRRIVSGITPNTSPAKRHSINYLLN